MSQRFVLLANPWVMAGAAILAVGAAVWAYFAKNDETERWLRFSPWGQAWDVNKRWRGYDEPEEVANAWAALMNPVSLQLQGGGYTLAAAVSAPEKTALTLEVRPHRTFRARHLRDYEAWLPVPLTEDGQGAEARDELAAALRQIGEGSDWAPRPDGGGYDWHVSAGNFVPLTRYYDRLLSERLWGRTSWLQQAVDGVEVRARARVRTALGTADAAAVIIQPARAYLGSAAD